MNQLRQRLIEHDWTLLVSLPQNDINLARAALRGGAQGLKIHLNVHHHASGTHFGSWNEERDNVINIVEVARESGASVGIVPGGETFATPAEFAELAAAGIDYFDAYPLDAPAWTLGQRDLDIMMAAYAGGTLEEMLALEAMGMRLCEASIVTQDLYGAPLNALDVARYKALQDALESPIIVPSQKKLVPQDVFALRAAGARAVLIGAIVTGRDADELENAVRAFANV